MNTDLGVGGCDAGGLSSSALWNCSCLGSESELCGALNLQWLNSPWAAVVYTQVEDNDLSSMSLMTSLIQLFCSSKRFVNSFSLRLYPSIRHIISWISSRVSFWVEGRWCAFYSGISLNLLLQLLIVMGVVSLSPIVGFKYTLFYDQFSVRHCCS